MASNSRNSGAGRTSTITIATAIVMVCLVFAVPVLYVLSTGPVVYLQSSGAVTFNDGTLDRFYYPIGWAGMKSQAFAQVMRWYLDFWE